MPFNINNVTLETSAYGKVRAYCNQDKCRETALGVVQTAADLHRVVCEHSGLVHSDPYPFD